MQAGSHSSIVQYCSRLKDPSNKEAREMDTTRKQERAKQRARNSPQVCALPQVVMRMHVHEPQCTNWMSDTVLTV